MCTNSSDMAAFERNNATTICAFCVETVTAGGAQPMQAPFVLTMHDGAVYTGFITYPVSHIQWVGPGRCIASQVLMTGTGTLKK